MKTYSILSFQKCKITSIYFIYILYFISIQNENVIIKQSTKLYKTKMLKIFLKMWILDGS